MMSTKTYIPEHYAPLLNLYDTQKAIGLLKRVFEDTLCGSLHLRRVSAPLFVEASSGLNDDLNGVERPVSFDIPAAGREAQVVHSLAKWKRMALYHYHFPVGEGLVTDMNAIRRDEIPDNLHSIYVDQRDWEKVIAPRREDAWVKDHPTTFLIGIGGALQSGKPHDGRAPDYDDWTLNGDILLWDDLLGRAIELSSMGIRVDAAALDRQLKTAGCDNRRELTFHKLLLEDKLPLTIGGGIGQSRLSMFLLGKAHIGEVQVSTWDDETIQTCHDAGIILL